MEPVTVEFIGRPESLLRALQGSKSGAAALKLELKEVSGTSATTAREQRSLGSALGFANREAHSAAGGYGHARRELHGLERGAIAGSGVFRGLGRSIAFASGSFLGAYGLIGVVRTSIGAAESLNTSIERTDAVFGKNAGVIRLWSRGTATNLGVARDQALGYADAIGTVFEQLGVKGARAAALSRQAVGRVSDISRVIPGAKPEEVSGALTQALAGRTTGLRQYQVVITNTMIKERAFQMGLVTTTHSSEKVKLAEDAVAIARAKAAKALSDYGAKTTNYVTAQDTLRRAEDALGKARAGSIGQLTAEQRALAVYSLFLDKTSKIHEQARKSAHGFTAEVAQMKAHLRDEEAVIGGALLPTLNRYLTRGNAWLSQGKNQRRITDDVKVAVKDLSHFLRDAAGVLHEVEGDVRGINRVTGGWKHTMELLIGLKVASWLRGVSGGFLPIGRNADAAAGKVRGVRGALMSINGFRAVASIVILEQLIRSVTGPTTAAPGTPGYGHTGAFDIAHDINRRTGKRGALGTVEHALSPSGLASLNPWRSKDPGTDPQIHSIVSKPGGSAVTQIIAGGRSRSAAERERDARGANRVATSRVVQPPPPPDFSGDTGGGGGGPLTVGEKAKKGRAGAASFETLPTSLQVQLARAQAAAASRQLPALRNLLAVEEKIAKYLDHEHATGKNLVKVAKDQAAVAKEIAATQKEIAAATDAWKKKLKDAVDSIKSQIGDLFQGPVLAPSDEQTKQMLGFPGPSIGSLTADVKAQNALFAKWQRELGVLRRRGAPADLISSLTAQGVAGEPYVATLAKARGPAFNAFLAQYRTRQKEITQAASATLHANTATVHIDRADVYEHSPGAGDARFGHQRSDGAVLSALAGMLLPYLQRRERATPTQRRSRYGGQAVGAG